MTSIELPKCVFLIVWFQRFTITFFDFLRNFDIQISNFEIFFRWSLEFWRIVVLLLCCFFPTIGTFPLFQVTLCENWIFAYTMIGSSNVYQLGFIRNNVWKFSRNDTVHSMITLKMTFGSVEALACLNETRYWFATVPIGVSRYLWEMTIRICIWWTKYDAKSKVTYFGGKVASFVFSWLEGKE